MTHLLPVCFFILLWGIFWYLLEKHDYSPSNARMSVALVLAFIAMPMIVIFTKLAIICLLFLKQEVLIQLPITPVEPRYEFIIYIIVVWNAAYTLKEIFKKIWGTTLDKKIISQD